MSLVNIVLLTLTELYGDIHYKIFSSTFNIFDFVKGTIGYIGVVYFLIRSFIGGNLMYVNGMWDGVSGIITTIVAYTCLGDRLNTVWQYVGLLMISLGTVLLHNGEIANTSVYHKYN